MTTNRNNDGWDAVDKMLKAREAQRVVVDEMTRQVKYILTKTADDGLQWHGTKCDLLEMLKVVYDKGTIINNDGTMAGYMYMARRVFNILHETMVSNPYAKAKRATQRKGIRRMTMTDRVRHAMASGEEGRVEAFWKTLITTPV